MPGLDDPEQVLIITAERILPTWLYVVFAGALVSAILSTVDSALLVAGSLVAHNIVVPMRPKMSPRGALTTNRVCVFAFGLLAYWLALHAEGVYALVEEASAFGTAGILVCTLFGLFTRLGDGRAAVPTLAVGVAVYAGGSHVLAIPHPYLTSLACSIATFSILALATRGREEDGEIIGT